MELIETITYQPQVLCILIRLAYQVEKTTFLYPPEYKQQVSVVISPPRHRPQPMQRCGTIGQGRVSYRYIHQ